MSTPPAPSRPQSCPLSPFPPVAATRKVKHEGLGVPWGFLKGWATPHRGGRPGSRGPSRQDGTDLCPPLTFPIIAIPSLRFGIVFLRITPSGGVPGSNSSFSCLTSHPWPRRCELAFAPQTPPSRPFPAQPGSWSTTSPDLDLSRFPFAEGSQVPVFVMPLPPAPRSSLASGRA